MTNRIKDCHISIMRLDPADAEIWISVYPENLTSATQVRGRLMGPRCAYATTVEVAYPLREHSREYEPPGMPNLGVPPMPGLKMRVIIPEPNLWEPQTPFTYQGTVELWHGKQQCDMVQIRCGLRTLQLGPRGLRLNGRPLLLRGIARSAFSEAEIRSLHQAGYNSLVVPAGPEMAQWKEAGDRFGFLVLGRINSKADAKYNDPRSSSPSWLGWLGHVDLFQDELSRIALPAVFSPMGIELSRAPEELPSGTSFIACEEMLLPSLEGIRLPKLAMRKAAARKDSRANGSAEGPDFLGWIEEEKSSASL
jgi:hypothetical protein